MNTRAEIAAHEAAVDRIHVVTVEQTGCPMDIPYELSGDWLKNWCCRHNATYYARPRDTFSEREAREQAVRERCNTVIVENMS